MYEVWERLVSGENKHLTEMVVATFFYDQDIRAYMTERMARNSRIASMKDDKRPCFELKVKGTGEEQIPSEWREWTW